MLYKDIIAESARLLGLNDGEETEGEGKEKLLLAAGLVTDELSRIYFPLTKEEELKPAGGKIPYSAFSRLPCAVLGVKRGGKSISFTRLYDGIEVDEGADRVLVRYNYAAGEVSEDGETEWRDGSVPMRVIACGIAAEYCLMYGLEDDAAMWDKRYRDALEELAFLHSSGRSIKARRWM